MKSKNQKNLTTSLSLFAPDEIIYKENTDLVIELLDKYFIKDMNDWKDLNADLIITDPPLE